MTKCPFCGRDLSEANHPLQEEYPDIVNVIVFCDEKCHEKYMESKVE